MFDETERQLSLNPEEMLSIARRNRWCLMLPLFLCWLIVWCTSWFLPTSYQSEALILVEQQKVPEQYVVSNVTVGLQERLQSMTQQILSRTRLQTTIDRFHLYRSRSGLGKLMQPEDPVEQMRKDIKIEAMQTQVGTSSRPNDLTAFRISYAAETPELAQLVNNELTSLFISESLRSEQQLSESTTKFLDNQLEEARTKLQKQEATVRDSKAKHFGSLPSQLQSNVEILSGLQAQLTNVQHALDVAKQQKLYLESQLQQIQAVPDAASGPMGGSVSLESLEKELNELRNRLSDARERYTEDHPDVIVLQRNIENTEHAIAKLEGGPAKDEKLESETAAAKEGTSGASPRIASGPVMQLRSQLKANELEIQNYQRQEKNIESDISSYQARLNLTPATEQALEAVSLGYEESKANYNSLLQKQNQSQLATSLEERQQGQQFRILDPPNFPGKPKSPNHLLLSLTGLGIGVLLGAGLTAFRELRTARVWHASDLEGAIPARVLGRIPHIETPQEGRFRMVTHRIEVAAILSMGVVIVAGNLYALYRG